MNSGKSSAARRPPVHRRDWAREDPSAEPQTQNQPRAQNPSPWYRPRRIQSAQVPPPRLQYRTPQALVVQQRLVHSEPLFVAVNPFEARRWRAPAQLQPESSNVPLIPPSVLSQAAARGDSAAYAPQRGHGLPYSPVIPGVPSRPPQQQWQMDVARTEPKPKAPPPLSVGRMATPSGAPLQRPLHFLEPTSEGEPRPRPLRSSARWLSDDPEPTKSDESEDDCAGADEEPRPRPPGACARCKNFKVKCEFETETGPCKRCLNGGHNCIIPRRQLRVRPRDERACARCKNLKLKCEFETETGPCKRCFDSGDDCIIPRRQLRVRPRERYRPVEHPRESHNIPRPPTRPPGTESAAVEDVTRYSPMDVHRVARSESSSSEGSVGNARRRRREPSSIGYSAHSSRSRRQSPQRPDGTSPALPTRAHTPIPYSSSRQSSIASMDLGTRSSSSRSRSPQRPETSTSSPMRQRPISAPRPISSRPLPQTQRIGPVPPPPIPYPHRGSEKVDSSALELPPPATSAIKYSKSSPLGIFIFIVPVALFLFDFVPRQLYLHLLLRIPSLYFSRVTRIFEDAQLSLPDIKRMARANADQWNTSENVIWQLSTQTPDQMPLPRSLLHFRSSWESFIDSLMREWKTFNIISVLLMSAILTMLQIEAASHPIIRTSALFSLICALMSLLYGCMYIIRFGTMRKMHKASSFATEAQKGTTSIWWNIWVLLAMPAVWLAWSIIMFLTCIMSFIWLSGSSQDPVDFVLSPRAALGPRIALTVVFFLGVIYFGLIVGTFHRYGDPLDREWMRVVNEWMKDTDPRQNPYGAQQPSSGPFNPSFQSATRDGATSKFQHAYQTQAAAPLMRALTEEGSPVAPPEPLTKLSPSAPLTSRPSAFLKTPRPTASQTMIPFTVMKLGHRNVEARITGHADPTWSGAIDADDWSRFILDISSAWHGQLSLTRPQAGATSIDLPAYTLLSLPRRPNPAPDSVHTVRDFIDLWNELYFYPRYLEASLVVQHDSSDPAFAVNLAALSFTSFFKQRKYHMAPMIIGSSP